MSIYFKLYNNPWLKSVGLFRLGSAKILNTDQQVILCFTCHSVNKYTNFIFVFQAGFQKLVVLHMLPNTLSIFWKQPGSLLTASVQNIFNMVAKIQKTKTTKNPTNPVLRF